MFETKATAEATAAGEKENGTVVQTPIQWFGSQNCANWLFDDTTISPLLSRRGMKNRQLTDSLTTIMNHFNDLSRAIESNVATQIKPPSRYARTVFRHLLPPLPLPGFHPPPRRSLLPIDLESFLTEVPPLSCWDIYKGWHSVHLPSAVLSRLDLNLSSQSVAESELRDSIMLLNPNLPENYHYQNEASKRSPRNEYDELVNCSLKELELLRLAILEEHFPESANLRLHQLRTENGGVSGIPQEDIDAYLSKMERKGTTPANVPRAPSSFHISGNKATTVDTTAPSNNIVQRNPLHEAHLPPLVPTTASEGISDGTEEDLIDITESVGRSLEKLGINSVDLQHTLAEFMKSTEGCGASRKIAKSFQPPNSIKRPKAGLSLVSLHPLLPEIELLGQNTRVVFVPDKVNPQCEATDIDSVEDAPDLEDEANRDILDPPEVMFTCDSAPANDGDYLARPLAEQISPNTLLGFKKFRGSQVMRPLGEFSIVRNGDLITSWSTKSSNSACFSVVAAKTLPDDLEPVRLLGTDKDRITLHSMVGQRNVEDCNPLTRRGAFLRHAPQEKPNAKGIEEEAVNQSIADVESDFHGGSWQALSDASVAPQCAIEMPASVIHFNSRERSNQLLEDDRDGSTVDEYQSEEDEDEDDDEQLPSSKASPADVKQDSEDDELTARELRRSRLDKGTKQGDASMDQTAEDNTNEVEYQYEDQYEYYEEDEFEPLAVVHTVPPELDSDVDMDEEE
eukprot:GHVH01014361.1.p1 GENE.GHVH01014361.1~~GHVH01014361.1.p1  ORF type:complete len:738 (-),score=121.20 GHVH01014361.1:3805-6018(-)